MTISLCQYKDIFGKPNTGFHRYRLFDIAIVDVLLTIFVSYVLAKIITIQFLYVLIGLFLLSIILHRLFCVRTRIDRLLFPD